ncbi:TIGR04282 family arsenosugar biosynthesis glycosyltransferase [Conexibacter sp. SYSU D00693]|uniref:TIGR04282 family arsenosugar biosynthesis glycosyltransferase n=1 Tax=Conexibacter sp. SYSU D00693 TaxID=2812560 RepID=UPI00196A9233|nr:TIGR04282 family arsenosugar biosynthesis glycosyltransferase [Conexibacter sp. SYSU D00693]
MRVVVMARQPVPGACKTRLEPLLGPDGCAALQAELVRHTVACCPRGRTLVATSGGDLAGLLPPGTPTVAQEGAHLGERIAHAVGVAGTPATVIGTDLPSLRPADLAAAEAALEGHDVVFGPADDGGWWVCALRAPAPEVFAIAPALWGGEEVLDACVAAARAAGRRVAFIDERTDLDTPADAARVLEDPATPAAVAAVLRGA